MLAIRGHLKKESKNKTYYSSYRQKEERLGLNIHEEIDKVLSRNFHRQDYEVHRYSHEAYIRMGWVR